MNREATSKRENFLCGCCAKPEEFNSDEVIFDYFGKEFTEYEYVVENLAIRPAPKKLLDLVPVHSTSISSKISSKTTTSDPPSEPLQPKPVSSVNMALQPQATPATGEGDFKKSDIDSLKIKDVSSDFISFKSPDPEHAKAGYFFNPSIKPPPKPFMNNSTFRSGDHRCFKDLNELRHVIRTKEYRTTKQILSDLCEASEESLNLKEIKAVKQTRPMSSEIKDTIETLKFKKPVSQFLPANNNKLYHTPGVYFADVKEDVCNPTCSDDQGDTDSVLDRILYPSQQSRGTNSCSVDSTAQTEVSRDNLCPKKDKRSLKWKIIINKHS